MVLVSWLVWLFVLVYLIYIVYFILVRSVVVLLVV